MHEAMVTLFRERPSLAPMLLAPTLDVAVPDDARIRVTSAEFAELHPPEYRADVVVRIDDPHGRAEDIYIVEVQLDVASDKLFSWPYYVTGARTRFRCPATLLVVTLDERAARWCATPIVLDRAGSTLRPVVIGPAAIPVVTDPERARALPELAVLSVIAHGSEPGSESIALAALAGCAQLDNPRANLYADLILAHIDQVARQALEALMAQQHYSYQSDFAKKYVAEGIAEGIEQGIEQGLERGRRETLSDTLRDLLEQRFGELSADVVDKIEHADADTLSRWTRRVLTAASPTDVLAE
jgi:hypothetical protein